MMGPTLLGALLCHSQGVWCYLGALWIDASEYMGHKDNSSKILSVTTLTGREERDDDEGGDFDSRLEDENQI